MTSKKNSRIITIDGPAGSGKSTIATALANELDYHQLDSGALYRVATYLALEFYSSKEPSSSDETPEINQEAGKKANEPDIGETAESAGFQKMLEASPLKIRFENKKQSLYLGDTPVDERIRQPRISRSIKPIADSVFVRNWVNQKLYDSIEGINVIIDGRDMGSKVFPNADYKFYLTANLKERTNRRFKELQVKDIEVEINELSEEIKRRDIEDKTREFGALQQPEGAFALDSTGMTQETVLETFKSQLEKNGITKDTSSRQPSSSIDQKIKKDVPVSLSFKEEQMTMENLIAEEQMNVPDMSKGSVVKGSVIRKEPEKNTEYVLLDLNSKSEGMLLIDEFDSIPDVGDTVEAIVKSFDSETGFVLLAKKELEIRRSMELLREAHQKELPVSGEIVKKLSSGYLVDVQKVNMFLPHSHIGDLLQETPTKKRNSLLGQIFTYKILELDKDRAGGTVSRKALQDKQNISNWNKLVQETEIGDIVEGKVIHYVRLGAFIEVGNVVGFLHHSNISWGRNTKKIEGVYPIGSIMQVRVLEIDSENMKLSLGVKQLTQDPWETILDEIKVGSTVEGTVSYMAKYGAFLNLKNDLEGLIPVSEISWLRKPEHTKKAFKLGSQVKARVLGINIKDKKITLGLKQLQENPWNVVMNQVKVGDVRKGKIKYIATYGMFVEITDAIDGLIRREDISWNERVDDLKSKYKKNQEIEFKVSHMDEANYRIACSVKHLTGNPYTEIKKKYSNRALVESKFVKMTKFGILAQLPEEIVGLIHLSEIPRGREQSLKESLKAGDTLNVVIKNVDVENERVALSLRGVDNAIEKVEMKKYIEKKDTTLMSKPFSSLKGMVTEN